MPRLVSGARMAWKGYQMYQNLRSHLGGRSTRGASRSGPPARRQGNRGGVYGGAALAASTFRMRSRRLPRKVARRKRRVARRVKKFKRRVASALPQRLKLPPKWHLYRATALVSPGGAISGAQATLLDFGHGISAHYDGLVALAAVAKGNYHFNGTSSLHQGVNPNFFLNVTKSYMIIFITNNSATSVYGKIAVCRPKKHINLQNMYPSPLASADISGPSNSGDPLIPNESMAYDSLPEASYGNVTGMTDEVHQTNLNDIGWVWQNSPSFRRYYKCKMKELVWAPMECKRFIFKMRKGISIDCATEYTLQPDTTTTAPPVSFVSTPTYYVTPQQTGFAEMHAKRGFFVSFKIHGIPVRNAAATEVSFTEPAMDIYWLSAYKYGWSVPGYREYHASGNPLTGTDQKVAIPGFGSVPAAPQIG